VPASLDDPLADLLANAGSTLVALEAARRSRRRPLVVVASSAAVYGNAETLPIPETQRREPVSPYGVSKLAAEEYVALYHRLYSVPCLAARLFSLYGPGQRKQVIFDLLSRLFDGEDPLVIRGKPEVARDFMFARDAARGLIALAKRAPAEGEVYNLATGRAVTLGELAELLIRTAELEARVTFTGILRPGDPLRWKADITRIAALGVRAETSLEDGLRATALWVRDDRTHHQS
jgi:UDP-glucose 4-epimerase